MTRPALVIRRRRPLGEPAPAVPDLAFSTLDGTSGAGRIVHALADGGVPVAAIHQLVIDPERAQADVAAIDLGERFALVVLGSHLANIPDGERRTACLSLAARHAARGARILVEHHPIDWAATAAPTPATAGGAPGMIDVQVDPPFVSAVSVYDVGGRVVRQPFRAQVLDDHELDAALASAGLVRTARRSHTWIEAAISDRA